MSPTVIESRHDHQKAARVLCAPRWASADKRVVLALVIFGLSSVISLKISGRLALSNIGQLLAASILLTVRPRISMAGMLAIAAVPCSAIAAAAYQWWDKSLPIHWPHIAYFTIVALLIERMIAIAPRVRAIGRAFDILLWTLLIYFLGWAMSDPEPFTHRIAFGFDDKSHAVLYISFFSFIALIRLKHWSRYPIAIGLAVMAAMTTSRLVGIVLPLLVLALAIDLISRQGRAGRMGIGAVACASVVAVAALIAIFPERFMVLERFRPHSFFDDAIIAHLLLIQFAFELKVADFATIVLGTGPGSFASALAANGIDVSLLGVIDPGAFEHLQDGTAPVHSSHATVLVEFPLWIFIGYVVGLLTLAWRLVKVRAWVTLCMFTSLQLSVAFYSSINEAFYWVMMAWAIHASLVGEGRSHAATATIQIDRQRRPRSAPEFVRDDVPSLRPTTS
ncbi:MAG: hypothetical protein H0X45_05375 [Planctomycetes bacterium]|nr:hypothetical protein [Planctomycetota bacterium]